MNSGAGAPRSASAFIRSSVVGSAQCRSSKASTSGCVRAPASSQATIAASCRRRSSSGASFGARSSGSGMSSSGASSGACSPGSSFTCASVASSSARRFSAGVSAPPKRWRPHSASGCSGVFCNSCEDDHSTQVCGVSASFWRNSSISRDLPRPGSPTIWTNLPLAARARAPSAGEAARAPPRARPAAVDAAREDPAPAAARAHDAVERRLARHALQLVRALVLDDEQARDLALHGGGDQNGSRLRRALHPRGNVGRLAEHFARRVDHHRPAFEPDAGGERGQALARRSWR